nr:immunoglobulin heavy chain junction region [Mus musculus]
CARNWDRYFDVW